MAIISAPDGTYYSNKTGKVYSREEVLSKIAEKQAQGNNSIFGKLFSGGTTSYEQTGAIDNAVKGDGGGVNDFATRAKNIVNANTVLETDSDKAARLREASNILGLDEQDSSTLMRGALGDDGIMKSALALAKKKQQEPDDWEQFAADHPATAKYLEQQKNAAISYDDVKPLGKLEDTVNTVKAHLEMMDVEQKIAELGRKYDSLNMSYNELSADQRVELNDLITKRQELQKNIDPWSVGNVLGGLISMKEDLPMALAVGAQTALLAGIGGAAVGGVGAVPAAITGFGAGFKVGMGASMGYRTAGTQYAENMMRADANGQYMDANSLRQGAWAAGLGMGVLGAVGTGRLTSKLPMGQVYDKFLRTTSPSVLNNPAARETAWRGYLSTLGIGLKEAAVQDVIFGGGGSALTYGSNRYSEALSGLDYSNREDGTLLQNITAGMEQFAPMALGTGVGFSVGGRMMGNALGGKKPPMPVADGLNKVINALDETKTAQRSPQAARDMINTVFGDTASASDVSVDARGLVRLYQEVDPDNPNRVYEVAEKLGVDAKTLDEAVATGGDVRVPVKDFALEFSSKGDSSNMRAEVLKEVRDIDGVTENERGEILNYEKQKINELKENMTAVTETDYDKSDPAYVAAADAVKSAYPKFGLKDSENMTKLVYAGFKQMEQNGVLKANGFDSAEQAIRAIEVRRKDAPENNSNLNQASEKTVDFSYTFGDNVAKEVFNKYLNDGIMGMVRDSVTKEIGEHIEQARIDLSKMADPIAREDARENIPYIRAMKTDFNQSFVQDNPAYKDRLAAKLEYARRCFDNDERIGKLGNVRQVDGDSRQEGVRRAGDAAVPESQSRGTGKGVRGENGGVQNGVSGGYRNARDHYEKLYNDIKKKHSDKQGAFRLQQTDERAANDVANTTMQELFQSAWHGTAHDFEKFDLGAVGNGQGGAVHGWGLYFAKNKQVAEKYRTSVAAYKNKETGETLPTAVTNAALELEERYGNAKAIEVLQKRINDNPKADNEKFDQQALDFLENKGSYERTKGKLYKADIPDKKDLIQEEYNYLNQTKTIQKRMAEAVDNLSPEQKEAFVGRLQQYFADRIEPSADVEKINAQVTAMEKAVSAVKKYHTSRLKKAMESAMERGYINESDIERVKSSPEEAEKVAAYYDSILQDTKKEAEKARKNAEPKQEEKRKAQQEKLESYKNTPSKLLQEEGVISGKEFYNGLAAALGDNKEASQYLNKHGIKGMTWGDEGGQFVIFDDKAIDIINKYNQEQGNKGNVLASYMPQEQGRAIIELYKNANPSSLAHEMLHHWVTLHENAFKTGKMEGRVLEDFEKLAKFAGHKLGTEWSTAEHEKLASAWETYLSEGRAPSLELAGAFSRFKRWMKRIYQTLTRHAIPINDDVRGVFDRMLASDAELALAEDFYANEPLFAGREMNETALREYAKLVISSHQEAQKEMDKRVMAEVNPAMKEVRDAAEKTIREDIAAQMQNEPVYAARMLFTAPRDTADFKAARDKAIKAKIDERVDLLVKESAQGIDKRGEVVSEHGTVTENWFVGDSMNHDWYREMFKRRGGKIPASWYNFIKAYKAGEKPLSKMPKSMRKEYEHIAEEQLTKGHKDSFLGDIPEDAEFINLKEGNPAMSWIVENGGGIRLDRASVYERYGKGALPERWLTDKNGYTLDDVADFVYDGKAGGDRLFEELTTKPTFSKELNKRVRAGMAEFKDNEYGTLRESAIKAVHNEKSLEAVGVELEIFEQMAAEMKAKNEQKTADAIAEGRKKAKVENKINEAKDAAAKKAAREQRMVDAAVARGTLRAKAAREMAKNQIADTAVGEIESWQKYAALGNRANKESVRLMSKGDVEGAIEAKNREILCKALALEAGKADTEVKKMMSFFKRVNKRGLKMNKVPHEFNVQTDKIMANYGLLTREPLKGLDGEIPLRVFLYGDKENYPDYKCVVDTYDTPFVADFLLNNQKKPYSELTFNEIRDLKNSVESIRKIGRNADKTLADGKKRNIDEIAKKMVEKLGTHVQRYANASSMAEIKKPLFSLTDLKKPEMVLRLMDKGEENGIFVNSIYNPLKLGLDDYANRSREIIKDVEKIMSDSGYTQREIAANKTKYYTFDFVEGGKVTHEQILLLCMNWGNDGNRDRARYYLKTGAEHSKKQWTEQELAELDSRALQMFEKLTAKDLKLVQAVWDYLETYAPEIRKHEVECSGVDPNMVEATGFSVMTVDGQNVTLRGGYFPIRYDPNKSVRAMDLDTANDLFKKNSAVQASVSHAHTKGRSQHIDRPLLLEWATFTDHLRNVNYDLAMRKPVRDVAKILSRADVQEAMSKAFGNDTVRMLNDWLRDIATDQRDMLKVSEKVLRWTRTRMSVAYLGLRTKALFIDLPQNVVTAYWQNGGNPPKEMLKFIFSGDYKAKIDFVNQRSPMMRDKYAFMDANLSDLRQDFMGDVGIVGKLTKGRVILPSNDKIQKLAFCVDSFADGAVNYPTWLQYHAEAMARGLSDAEASLEADAKTRRQSVDTSKAGMAAIQRGSESLKLITPFYSYFNAYLNRLLYDYGMVKIKWADGQRLDSVGLAVRAVGLGMALPVMIEAIMQGYFLNNDQTKDKKKHAENIKKEMISAAISYPANTLPVVGQFVTTGVNKFIGKKNTRFELSPVESAFNTMTDTFGAIAKYSDSHGDAEAEKKLVEAMAKTAAVSAPYPNIINTWALNMWDVFAKGGDITLADIVTRRVNQK